MNKEVIIDIENPKDNDLISRQAVLDLIADYDLSMGQVVKGIHALPSINPQESKWIPVSERLPEDGGNYLVTITFDIGGEELVREVRKDFFCILSKKWLNLSDDDVIAWMPLPKPYEP